MLFWTAPNAPASPRVPSWLVKSWGEWLVCSMQRPRSLLMSRVATRESPLQHLLLDLLRLEFLLPARVHHHEILDRPQCREEPRPRPAPHCRLVTGPERLQ